MDENTCAWDGCDRKPFARGYCSRCYQRARKHGGMAKVREWNPQAGPCSAEGCEEPATIKGLCKPHYMRQYRHGDLDVQPTVRQGPTCSVEGCDEKPHGRGLCNKHWARRRRHGDANAPVESRQRNKGLTCSGPECDRPAVARGLCNTHDAQQRSGNPLTPIRDYKPKGQPCEVAGCDGTSLSLGLCQTHYRRKMRGEDNWYRPIVRRAPHGAGHVDANGYRIITVNGKTVREHRHLAEQLLGRPLLPTEDVHHRNTVRSDNSTDGPFRMDETGNLVSGNLVVWLHSTGQPRGGEVGPVLDEIRRRVAAGEGTAQDQEILALYGELVPAN